MDPIFANASPEAKALRAAAFSFARYDPDVTSDPHDNLGKTLNHALLLTAVAYAKAYSAAQRRDEALKRGREWRKRLKRELKANKPPTSSQLLKSLNGTIDELGPSVRLANRLSQERIHYVGQLVKKSDDELRRLNWFGRNMLRETKELLSTLGLSLGMNIPAWKPPRSP